MPSSRPRTRGALVLVALIALAAFVAASCRSLLSRKYEYDEDVHLALDGSAMVYVNASLAALVALRGLDLDVDPRARLDLDKIRAAYESPVSRVESATGSRRDNRRYVHLRIEVPDIRRLHEVGPFTWSRYEIDRHGELIRFRQNVGPSAARDVGDVGWTGGELIAFRLHLPSRVPFHNSPSREIERGNIIVWNQRLTDRLAGEPLAIEAHMEPESILIRTLTLFGITIALALATFALAIWWIVRKGRRLAKSGDLTI
jgi:hypothetical protein